MTGADGSAPSPGPPDGESDDPLVGSVLAGRYRILERLGEGAMGAVYLGEHIKIGRRDAIKVLRDSMARDPEAIARFTRGARNSSQIRHRNVCTIYDFSDTSEGTQFLAMEFVSGESLTDLIEREGPLPPVRALDLAIQIAEGLQAAHDLEIVHRDLKPDNVMVARDRKGGDLVKVVDFDIAKGSADGEGADVTRLGFVVGTPQYMSPEQLTGERLDGRSDVYSLAIVLFRMLTGRLPFDGESTQEVMINRLTVSPHTLASVRPDRTFPSELEGLLGHALERDAENRMVSAEAMAAALREIRGRLAPQPEPVPSEPIPPTRVVPSTETTLPRPEPPPGRPGVSTAVKVGGGVAAAVLLAVVAFAALTGGEDVLVAAVRVQPASATLQPSGTVVLEARPTGSDGQVVSDAPVQWTSSDPAVATVDGSGRVAGVSPGTATVVASSRGVTGSAEIRVSGAASVILGESEVRLRSRVGEPDPPPYRVSLRSEGVTALTAAARGPGGGAASWLTPTVSDDGSALVLAVATAGLGAGRHAAFVSVAGGAGAPALAELPVTLEIAPREGPAPGPSPPARPSEGEVRTAVTRYIRELSRPPVPGGRATAVRDSARAFWDRTDLGDEVRGAAAYSVCLAEMELGDAEAALQWVREALRLDPDNAGYAAMRDALGGP